MVDSNIDCLILVESWLTSSHDSSNFCIDGYNLFRADRTLESGKQSGGGIAFYVKDNLTCIHLETYTICSPDIEFTCLKVKLTNNRPFYVCGVYRPPSGNIDEFISSLENVVTEIVSDRISEVILLGDNNIDICSKKGQNYRKYHDYVSRNGYQHIINIPTHFNSVDVSKTCLDHILSNRPEFYALSGICPITVTDHYLTFVFRKRPKLKNDNIYLSARSYKKFNENVFKHDLEKHDWSECLTADNPDDAWISYRDNLLNIIDKHAPMKRMRFSSNLPAWMTRECLAEIKDRDLKDCKYRKTNSIFDLAIAKKQRNVVTNMKKKIVEIA